MTRVPIRAAATLVVVRDAAAGLEVCVVRRHPRSAFVGGAYVFPGGAVDAADASDGAWLRGGEHAIASDLGRAAPFASLAHRVAAIRETLEECSLLAGGGAPLQEPPDQIGAEVRAGGASALRAACERSDISLALDELHYLAHWVTPAGAPRRYDTRFFLTAAIDAAAPELVCDGTEAVEARWITPSGLLDLHAAGEAPMLPPTTATLRWLLPHHTAAAATAAAAALREVAPIEPRVVTDHRGAQRIVTAEDRAWPGGYQGGAALPQWPRP